MEYGITLNRLFLRHIMIKDDRYINDGMNAFERNIKRLVDFFIATMGMIVFSPLFLICYIAVKREDGGPAIFRQERIGRFGRPFYIYKFRSMKVDAEKNGPASSFGCIILTNCHNCGMCFVEIWHLSVRDRKDNILSTKSWSMIHVISICIR
jgi:lipopolysaccharide/colanic/teichoic acid biosynthesis glycosyltransferase